MAFTTMYDKATVKNACLYVNDGLWYMDITYLVEDDHSIVEYRIPKVRIRIEQALLLHNIDFDDSRFSSYILALPHQDLRIEPCSDGRVYTTRIVQTKQKEMTLSEIEAALGYKIKIVNEKETPEDDRGGSE